jgi:hypothetical protein
MESSCKIQEDSSWNRAVVQAVEIILHSLVTLNVGQEAKSYRNIRTMVYIVNYFAHQLAFLLTEM